MTIEAWLHAAIADAEARNLPELKPLLDSLARATTALRAADFNDSADPSVAGRQPEVGGRPSRGGGQPS